ncbi:MAG: ACP S-malonyltransferase [Candidatus Omnitrophota bacterium]|nr:ACP S-malonyltransferase [Candidatus Omnitrophota bacterium]
MTPFALLFPGQGAQSVGMGKELAEAFPIARARFDEADSILGYSLSKLCWEGPAEELTRTEHCQPALYVTSMAALAALESLGPVKPSAAAGLSLGEYTALAAAGAVSFADGLKLVRLRGQAMEEAARARPGTMASVLGLDLEQLQGVCAETGAQVANLNSPGQVVISGTAESVAAASAKAKEKGAKRVIPLEVGGAFHSRLMEPAGLRLRQGLQSFAVQAPRYPVASNVTGAYHGDPAQIRELLVRQLTEPVQWIACVRTMAEKDIKTYVEVGSGTVLKGLVRKIDPEAAVYSAGTPEEIRGWRFEA